MPEPGRAGPSYDLVAERYAAEIAGELTHKPFDRGLLDAVAELAGGGPVADVGCGPGTWPRTWPAAAPGHVGPGPLSPACAPSPGPRACRLPPRT